MAKASEALAGPSRSASQPTMLVHSGVGQEEPGDFHILTAPSWSEAHLHHSIQDVGSMPEPDVTDSEETAENECTRPRLTIV